MAFTTVKGSGGAPDSFVGTSGVDAIAFTASRATYFLGAQADNDVVAWVGTATSPITVTDATIRGGDGNDLFTATNTVFASVFINGNAGDDVFDFWPGPTSFLGSTLQGGQGDDFLNLDSVSSSVVNGNKGDDTIEIGGLEGGAIVSNSSVYGGQGDDLISLYGTIQDTLIDGGLGDDYIAGNQATTGITASGNEGDDSVCGGADDDTLYGNVGNDLVAGNGGSDTIVGGLGADTLWGYYYETEGQEGIDGANLFVFNAGDSFAATAGAGASVTFGNGVDFIADFGTTDEFQYNGVIFDLADQGATGIAEIVNGAYVITEASTNGAVAVLGNWDVDTQTFTGGFVDEVLFFASSAGVGTVIGASAVEAVVVNVADIV